MCLVIRVLNMDLLCWVFYLLYGVKFDFSMDYEDKFGVFKWVYLFKVIEMVWKGRDFLILVFFIG